MNFYDILNLISPDIASALSTLWTIFIYGGWVPILILGVYILYNMYMDEIRSQYIGSVEWTFLNIKIPKENLASYIAVEQIYYQLHTVQKGFTFAETYIEGMIPVWYTFEIVSFGGHISFIIRCPKAFKMVVEGAFYSVYPTAEISEVEDYFKDTEYDPKTSSFDMFSFEMEMINNQALPIKSFAEFEHSVAETKIIDPLNMLIESMAKIKENEMLGVQIIATPIAEKDWVPDALAYAKELIGEKKKSAPTLLDEIKSALNNFNIFSANKAAEEEKSENKWMSLTDIEKLKVNSIQKKASKPGFNIKIRVMYLAPKGQVDKLRITYVLGTTRSYGDGSRNGLKVEGSTKTKVDYRFSSTLEQPLIDWLQNRRKSRFFTGWKGRSRWVGANQFVVSTEELAMLYHLPMTLTTLPSQVPQVEVKKTEPPVNLPI